MCAFITLRIDVDDLTNRNRTSVTSLLVLVTLFGSITNKDAYPHTTEFKYIDLWYLWYLINIFAIICLHVAISRVSDVENFANITTTVYPFHHMDENKEETSEETSIRKKKLMNNIMSVFIFLSMITFNTLYFLLTH